MGLYHFTAKAVSMGKGQSAVHTAAYNARCQLHDERESRDTKDYGYKGRTEFSGIFAPKDAPAWAHDREQLWNRATAAERQANGQPARNVEFALPHELNAEQRRQLVTDFAREAFARRGMVADVSIHAPHDRNDDRNYHVHCLLTMRRLNGAEFAKTKEREWNGKAELEHWRDKWAQMGARALERAGHQQEADRFRHGHKTLAAQREAALARGDAEHAERCDKEAGIHKGAAISAMERRNDTRLADNDKAREAKAIDERNAARDEIRATEKELKEARRDADRQRDRNPAASHPAYAPEPDKSQAEREERAEQPKPERWHNRDETKTEKIVNRVQAEAERGGYWVGGALYEEGFTLARVDAAGKDAVDDDFRRRFENEKLQGKDDARLRHSTFAEGELVLVSKYGDVYRLNPRHVGLEKLERDFTGGKGETPTLSTALNFFATERQQQKTDRQAARHERYQEREAGRYERQNANPRRSSDDKGFKVVDGKGMVTSLSSFIEGLFGMGGRTDAEKENAAQQAEAIEALENIMESIERGDTLSAADVRNLLPIDIENIRFKGDAYLRSMIRDLERERERDNDFSRTRER